MERRSGSRSAEFRRPSGRRRDLDHAATLGAGVDLPDRIGTADLEPRPARFASYSEWFHRATRSDGRINECGERFDGWKFVTHDSDEIVGFIAPFIIPCGRIADFRELLPHHITSFPCERGAGISPRVCPCGTPLAIPGDVPLPAPGWSQRFVRFYRPTAR
jgi:hypothetical protein